MPIGAVGGKKELMDLLSPVGNVYQAGTLSGNPVAVAAGLAMMDLIEKENPYPRLATLGEQIESGLTDAARSAGVPFCCSCLGGMFTPYFTGARPTDLATAKQSDTARFAAFFREMRKRGYYLPPSQFEVAFVSAAHTEADISGFVGAAAEALTQVAS